jgi:hypothetical protein
MANERDCFTLTISEAFPEDEGLYKCVATNSAGSAVSSANLQLIGAPMQQEIHQPNAQVVHEPNESRPPLSKQQLMHQQQLQQQRAVQQQQIDSQRQKQLKLQQQQQQQVIKQKQVQQQSAPPTVQPIASAQVKPIAPQIAPLVAQTAGVGKTIRFETSVSGQPAPTLNWFKDGVALATDSRITFGGCGNGACSLQIVQVQLSDSGMYTLCAENQGGRSKSTAQLLVVEDEQLLQNAVITTTSKGHDGQQVTQRKQQQQQLTATTSGSKSSDRSPSPGKKSSEDKKRKQSKKKSKSEKADKSDKSE